MPVFHPWRFTLIRPLGDPPVQKHQAFGQGPWLACGSSDKKISVGPGETLGLPRFHTYLFLIDKSNMAWTFHLKRSTSGHIYLRLSLFVSNDVKIITNMYTVLTQLTKNTNKLRHLSSQACFAGWKQGSLVRICQNTVKKEPDLICPPTCC